MRVEETTSVNRFISLRQPPPPPAETVLVELFELLESYGPAWYTQEHHNKAVAALVDRHW